MVSSAASLTTGALSLADPSSDPRVIPSAPGLSASLSALSEGWAGSVSICTVAPSSGFSTPASSLRPGAESETALASTPSLGSVADLRVGALQAITRRRARRTG